MSMAMTIIHNLTIKSLYSFLWAIKCIIKTLKRRESHKKLLLLLFQHILDRNGHPHVCWASDRRKKKVCLFIFGKWLLVFFRPPSPVCIVLHSDIIVHITFEFNEPHTLSCAFKARASSKCRFVCEKEDMCTWFDLSHCMCWIPYVTNFISFSTLSLVHSITIGNWIYIYVFYRAQRSKVAGFILL